MVLLSTGIRWTASAAKHGILREDALYALLHPVATAELAGEPGETTVVYIGHPHGQTDWYIEVIAAHREPRDVLIFHVMNLSSLYRPLLDESDADD